LSSGILRLENQYLSLEEACSNRLASLATLGDTPLSASAQACGIGDGGAGGLAIKRYGRLSV
jgi:hypothetical protein